MALGRRTHPLAALAFVLLGNLMFCGKDKDETKELLEKGLKSLQVQDWTSASHYFSKVIERDAKNPVARMGMAMTHAGILFKQIETVVLEVGSIIAQSVGGLSPRIRTHQSTIEQSTVNDVLFYILDSNLLRPISTIIENAEIAAQSESDWNMYVENLIWTIKIGDRVFWQIGVTGELDRTDAILMALSFRLIEVALKIILSVDIHLDARNLSRIYDFVEEIGGMRAIQKNPRIVVLNILPFILNDKPSFLGVEPKRGLRFMKEDVPTAIKMISKHGVDFYDSILAEKDDQIDDVIAYIQEEGEVEKLGKLAFPTTSTYFADNDLSDRIGRRVASVSIPPPDLRYFFENLGKSLEGEKVGWGDIIEITSFVVVVILKTGIFDSVIDALAGAAGRSGIPPNIVSGIGSMVNPGFIAGIVKGVVPDQIAFSLKPIFERPLAVRDLLPVWTDEPAFLVEWECHSNSPDITPLAEDNPAFLFFCKYPKMRYCFEKAEGRRCNIRFLDCVWTPLSVEDKVCDTYCGFDCGGQEDAEDICLSRREHECLTFCIEREDVVYPDGARVSKCKGSLSFLDSEHFRPRPGTKNNHGKGAIPQDGISSVVPYVLFQDPTFYGVLYINKDFLRTSIPSAYRGGISGSGYQPPNDFELNVFLQVVGRNLTNLLSQFGIF